MSHKRFSLRTLFLATTFLVMALAILLLTIELIPLRAEVQRLRDEAGQLTIDDPTKVHAIQLFPEDQSTWNWKLHIPRGTKSIGAESYVGVLPSDGEEPLITDCIPVNLSDPLKPISAAVEATVTVQIHEDQQGELRVTTSLKIPENQSSRANKVSEDEFLRMHLSSYSQVDQVAFRTKYFDQSDQHVLLRKIFLVKGQEQLGLLVWIRTSKD